MKTTNIISFVALSLSLVLVPVATHSSEPDPTHEDPSGNGELSEKDVEDLIKRVVEEGMEAIELYTYDFESQGEHLNHWKNKEASEQKNDIEKIHEEWKRIGFCEDYFRWYDESKAKCEEGWEQIGVGCKELKEWHDHSSANSKCSDFIRDGQQRDKKQELRLLKQKSSERFSKAMDEHVSELANLEAEVKGRKFLIASEMQNLENLFATRNDLDGKLLEEFKKDYDFLTGSMERICTNINSEMNRAKQVLVANVCVAVDGLDGKVQPFQEADFNENFQTGIELAFDEEGINVDVLYVEIIDQYYEKDEQVDENRVLSTRRLRMVVGASYRCACNDGSTSLKSDVVRRLGSSSLERKATRPKIPKGPSSLEGKATRTKLSKGQTRRLKDKKDGKKSGKKDSSDIMWYSAVEADFGETLSKSIEYAFDDTITVEAFPCSDMMNSESEV